MPNLADEVASLNINATLLLEKYDGAFTALGEAGELIKLELESVVQDAENRLENTMVVSTTAINSNSVVVNGYATDFTLNAIAYLESIEVASFEVDWGDGSTKQTVPASNSSALISHTFTNGVLGATYSVKVTATDSLGNKGAMATKVVTIADNHAPTAPTVTTPNEVSKLDTFEITMAGSTDADGDAITYTLTSSHFTFSKSVGIVANEVITVTAPDVEDDATYTFTARAVDARGMSSTSVVKSVLVKSSSMGGAFGRLWNITDDVYKRVGLNPSSFSTATKAEFDNWLSPTAQRVNDNDTSSPCDLTTELDTNPNLPFATIARKVVNKTGVVSTFDHATAPTTNEQIMSEIQKTHYIHAIVVANSKEYDVQFVSLNPFEVDIVNDLGLTSVTSITCFNHASGISSGTVSSNVITSALHPAFIWHDDSEAIDTYVGSFPSVTGRSTFGSKATDTITLPTARTQHTAFGTNFNQHDFWNESLIKILAYIERGSNYLEGSETKWDGFAWSGAVQGDVQNCGLTLSLQNKTGVIKDGSNRIIANSYRGIENYHSNLRMWVDGININDGKVYLAKAGSTYVSDSAAAPYFDSGYVSIATSNGNIEKWLAGTFIPNPTAGGTSTSKVTDMMYGSTGWRVLLVSGHLPYPGYSGLSYWYANNVSSYSDWPIVSRASFRKFLN